MKKSIALIIVVAMIFCGNVLTFAGTDSDITVWDSGGHEIIVEVPKDATGDVDYGDQVANRYKLKTPTAIPDDGVTFTPVEHTEDNILKYEKLNEEASGDGIVTTFSVKARRAGGYADLDGDYKYNLEITLSDGQHFEFPCTLKISAVPMVYIAANGTTDVWGANTSGTFQVGETTKLDAIIKDSTATSGKDYKVEWYVEDNQNPQKVKIETTPTAGYDGSHTQWVGSTATITGLSSGYVTVGVKLSVGGDLQYSWNCQDTRVLPSVSDVPGENYWLYGEGNYYEVNESSFDDRYVNEPYGDLDDVYTLDSPAQVSNITFSGQDASCFSWEKNYEVESAGKWRTEIQFYKQLPTTEPKTYTATGTITFASGDPMIFDCQVEVTKDFTLDFEWDDDQFYVDKGSRIQINVTDDEPGRSYKYVWTMVEGPECAGFASVANAPNDHTITRGPKTDKSDYVLVYGHKEGTVTLECLVTGLVNGQYVSWKNMLHDIPVGVPKGLSGGVNDIVTTIQSGNDSKLTVPSGEGLSPDQLQALMDKATGGAKVTLTPEDGKDDVTLTFDPNAITQAALDKMNGQVFTPAFTPAMPPEAGYEGIVPANGQWVQFAYSGDLPAPMTVRMKVDPSFAGDSLTLWRYINGRLVSQPTTVTRDRNYLVFTLDHFSTYAVYPAGFNPNPPDNYVPSFRPESSGSSGGGGGSSSHSSSAVSKGILNGSALSVKTTAAAKSVSIADATNAAKKAIAQAKADGKSTASVQFVNAASLSKATLDAVQKAGNQKGIKVAVCADTVMNGTVAARLYIDPTAATLDNEIGTEVQLDNPVIDQHFKKYFKNNLKAIKFMHQGSFGMELGVAIKLDLQKIDASKIVLYSYDVASNSYQKLPNQTFFIDKNGYLHFYVTSGGYVVISEGIL